MALQFLSKEWFDAVIAMRNEAVATLGDAGLPADLKAVKLNIAVPHPEGEKHFSVLDGDARIGHIDDAHAKVTVEYDVARRLFLEGDPAAGLQAFMAGQIKIDGDLSKLLVVQQYMTAQATPEQAALRQRILAFTVA